MQKSGKYWNINHNVPSSTQRTPATMYEVLFHCDEGNQSQSPTKSQHLLSLLSLFYETFLHL